VLSTILQEGEGEGGQSAGNKGGKGGEGGGGKKSMEVVESEAFVELAKAADFSDAVSGQVSQL